MNSGPLETRERPKYRSLVQVRDTRLAAGLYLIDDRRRRARTVLCNELVDFSDVSAGTRCVPQSHRPHFSQSATISSSLTNSPRRACPRPSSTAARCVSGTTNGSLPAAAICSRRRLAYLREACAPFRWHLRGSWSLEQSSAIGSEMRDAAPSPRAGKRVEKRGCQLRTHCR